MRKAANSSVAHFRLLPVASHPQSVACAKTVPESEVFMPLGLVVSEKQIPQITENTEKPK